MDATGLRLHLSRCKKQNRRCKPIKSLEFCTTTKYIGEQRGTDDEYVGGFSVINVKVIVNIFQKETSEYFGLLPEAVYYVGFNYKF